MPNVPKVPEAPSQRRYLLGAIAGFVLASRWGGALARNLLPATPAQTSGPFYPTLRPLDQDMDLTVVAGRSGRAKGQVIHLTGRVLDSNGKPVPGARIELWQANAGGRYDHPDDANPEPLDPDFQGFATQLTDAEGRYRFKTIKPGAYPMNPANPVNVRPPHIHLDVVAADEHLVTQMYFPGEKLNTQDRIFNAIKGSKDTVIAKVIAPTPDIEPGASLLHFDIVLA
jgi:protocatechuate 3,4-dioxygenase beta subunit